MRQGSMVYPDSAAASDRDESAGGKESFESTGPIGTGQYVVQEGDCISSIAADLGHYWQTIWYHPDNAELRRVRNDPSALLPGDRITVPRIRPKMKSGQTEQRHKFRLRGEPVIFRLRIMEEPEDTQNEVTEPEVDEDPDAIEATREYSAPEAQNREDVPRANVPYTLMIDGKWCQGTTDENGVIEQPIPGNARHGKLILEPGTPRETEILIELGHLCPLSDWQGLKERLANLGFESEDRSNEATDGARGALLAFQKKFGLPLTGEADQTTLDKIREIHGG